MHGASRLGAGWESVGSPGAGASVVATAPPATAVATGAHEAHDDAVLGRHLIARGMKPGPSFGDILERCREVQDEHGWTDPDRILDFVLTEGDRND